MSNITHGIKTNIADYDVKVMGVTVDRTTRTTEDIANKLHTEEITLAASDWQLYTDQGDLNGYYVQVKHFTAVHDPRGEVGLVATTTLPTAAEEDAFALLEYAVGNTTLNTVTFACNSAPTSDFKVYVKGVTL